MGINTGAFFGQIVPGLLVEKIGWGWGFGAAGVGMLVGVISFGLFAKKTLGTLGLEPARDPDTAVQARAERGASALRISSSRLRQRRPARSGISESRSAGSRPLRRLRGRYRRERRDVT